MKLLFEKKVYDDIEELSGSKMTKTNLPTQVFSLDEAISLYNEGLLQGMRGNSFSLNAKDYFKQKFELDI